MSTGLQKPNHVAHRCCTWLAHVALDHEALGRLRPCITNRMKDGPLRGAACLVIAGGDGPLKVHAEALAVAQQARAHVVVQRMQLHEVVLDRRACTRTQVGNQCPYSIAGSASDSLQCKVDSLKHHTQQDCMHQHNTTSILDSHNHEKK